MQEIEGRITYSATDLVGFLACEHLTNLDRAAAAGLVARPYRNDPILALLSHRGLEHERRFLDALRQQRPTATVGLLEPDPTSRTSVSEAAAATLAALQRGDEIVYQATLWDGRWQGRADFLLRVEAPSALGAWSYEVYDTKLARETTAGAVLQLSLYSDLLARAQGRKPEWMYVVLGGDGAHPEAHRVAHYEAYYRRLRREFETFVQAGPPVFPPATRPEPVEHCEVCRWSERCREERRRVDDLSLVAGITRRQRHGLRDREVTTRRGLAEVPLPLPWSVDGASADSIVKVREQARLQVAGERAGRVLYELIEPSAATAGDGLASLPPPSLGDLFFDMEGDPFAFEAGFDYLFGIVEPGRRDGDGRPTYHRFWSRDDDGNFSPAGERRAFERVVDLFLDRLASDPGLHIYHYAPYEPAAMGRLMGRHATCETEIDRLLRGGVFVDLYRAVRQGVRASVESYSIKRLEPLYDFARTVDLRDAGSSVVAFSTWLQMGGDRGGDPKTLERIEGYNGDDCRSNWRLRAWLEERRGEWSVHHGAELPRPDPQPKDASDTVTAQVEAVRRVEELLCADVPVDPAARTDEQRARWLLAQLLSWHRREEKSGWWRYFRLRDDFTDEERIEEPEPLGGLVFVESLSGTGRLPIHRFRFPPQETEVDVGKRVIDPATKKSPGQVVAMNAAAGTIDLQRTAASAGSHPRSLLPDLVVQARAQPDALLRMGTWVAEHGVAAPGPWRAARELLLRRAPDHGQEPGAPLAGSDAAAAAAERLVLALDGGCLAIQGPPGSGKSTTAAAMIVALVREGRRVGVTANSHKVIGNLLDKVAAAARAAGLSIRLGQKPATGASCTCASALECKTNEAVDTALERGAVDVVGATAFTWARGELAAAIDVLFVDEAGQMSLANALAAAQAAHSLVLLGDPQQLDQPVQGSHPPGADRSALAHLLEDHATMPPHLGLFLARTWRLHPDLCAFTSEAFYDGLLAPEAICAARTLRAEGPVAGTGLRFLRVDHAGNGKASREEAAALAERVRALLSSGARWIDETGSERALTLDDILIITPYNAQVRAIADALPDARVGTVDKFQGQEAPIAIYSMASSSADDAPRGMEFLYSLHRLNVATSRAQALAVLVASPELLRARCRTPRQLRLANALCRLVDRT